MSIDKSIQGSNTDKKNASINVSKKQSCQNRAVNTNHPVDQLLCYWAFIVKNLKIPLFTIKLLTNMKIICP